MWICNWLLCEYDVLGKVFGIKKKYIVVIVDEVYVGYFNIYNFGEFFLDDCFKFFEK